MRVIKLQSAKRDKRSVSCLLWVYVFRGNNYGQWQKLGEEVDAKHVDYVAPYGINFDQPPNKCR